VHLGLHVFPPLSRFMLHVPHVHWPLGHEEPTIDVQLPPHALSVGAQGTRGMVLPAEKALHLQGQSKAPELVVRLQDEYVQELLGHPLPA
jgi:hypothetical protein